MEVVDPVKVSWGVSDLEAVVLLLVMERSSAVTNNSNKLGIEFLLTELSLAKSFIDIAENTKISDQRRQSYLDAEKAYQSILHFLPRFQLTVQEKLVVEEKLARLRVRFASAGIEVGKE